MVTFQIQIASDVIKNPAISHESFVVYCKLIQHYYVHKGKTNKLNIDHKKFMYFSNIKSNQTLKKCINQLNECGLVDNKIDTLPRNGLIEINLNKDYLTNNKSFKFAQLPHYFLDKCVLDRLGSIGLRLMYYLRSYINKGEEFCFCSRETISKEIGSNPKTVDKYTEILKKCKLVKVVKHKLESTYEFEINEFGVEKEKFTKFNNHYYLRFDKFDDAHMKLKNNST